MVELQSFKSRLRPFKSRLRPFKSLLITEPSVRLGLFRRLRPISRSFGVPRGKPIDRYFIEDFVARHRADIRGRVLEGGGGPSYARLFGGPDVEHVDILYPKPGFPDGTLVGNLETDDGIPVSAYDCLVMTQVYTHIYDARAAVATSYRALKPGGVLLATLDGIGQISLIDKHNWGVFWRFTDDSATRLFGDVFGPDNIAVETYGNVFTACAFLQCLAVEDLSERELNYRDPEYQMTIAVRAVKPA